MAVTPVGTPAFIDYSTYGSGLNLPLPSTGNDHVTFASIAVKNTVVEAGVAITGASVKSWDFMYVSPTSDGQAVMGVSITTNGNAAATALVTITGYVSGDYIGYTSASYSDVGTIAVGSLTSASGNSPPAPYTIPGVTEVTGGRVVLIGGQNYAGTTAPTSSGFAGMAAAGTWMLNRATVTPGPSGAISVTPAIDWQTSTGFAISVSPAASGTNYNETGRSVTIASTVSATDSKTRPAEAFPFIGQRSLRARATATDRTKTMANFVLSLLVGKVSTTNNYNETNRNIVVASTITCTNQADFKEVAVVLDSFVTASDVGQIPWWEVGGPTGDPIQIWNPPYKQGFAFKPVVNVTLYGARIWRVSSNSTPSDGAPELCLSDAVDWAPVDHRATMVPQSHPTVSQWGTTTFATPIPLTAGVTKLLWIQSMVGSVGVPIAREAGRFTSTVTSPGGTLESVNPSSHYNTPASFPDQAPLGRADAWYWIDPIVGVLAASLVVNVTSTVTCTDTYTVAPTGYNETGRQVDVVSTTTLPLGVFTPALSYVTFPGASGDIVWAPNPFTIGANNAEFVWWMRLPDYTPAVNRILFSQQGNAPNYGWILRWQTTGAVYWQFSTTGSNTSSVTTGTGGSALVNNTAYWFRYRWNRSNQNCVLEYAANQPTAPTSWTSLATGGSGGAVTIHPTTAKLTVGSIEDGTFQVLVGEIGPAFIRLAFDGTNAWTLDPKNWVSGTSWVNDLGQTNTFGGATAITSGNDSGNIAYSEHRSVDVVSTITSTDTHTPGVGNPKVATLTDDFAASISAVRWPDSSVQTVWEAGRAKIPVTTSYYSLQTGLTAGQAYDLTASGVYAKVVCPAAGSGSREILFSVFSQSATPQANKLVMLVSGTSLIARRVTASTSTDLFSATYNATSHAWWRIREAAGTIYWDTSPDSATWTNFTSVAAPAWDLTKVAVGFTAGYWGTETAADAFIDNVNVAVAAPINETGRQVTITSTVSVTHRSSYRQTLPVTAKIAVPSYFWVTWYNAPGGNHDWERMQASATTQEFAICNPNSGPDAALNADWVTQIANAHAAGLKVLGYVRTNYTVFTAAAVKADVDKYYAWYSVDGIFFDEASWEQANQPYYQDIHDYVKAQTGDRKVVINPGIPGVHESYMRACDLVMNYEGYAADYTGTSFPAWVANYPPSRFWHCIHDVTGGAQRDTLYSAALTNNAGYLYLTTDSRDTGDANPYNSLPPEPYWSDFLRQVGRPSITTINVTEQFGYQETLAVTVTSTVTVTDQADFKEAVLFDSLVTSSTTGPLGVWDDVGTTHVQVWDTPFKQGLVFTANQNVMVHGARWWRPGTEDGIDPGNDIMLRLGPISGTATHAVNYDAPWDPGTPQWVTILFDTPISVAAGQTRHIYVNPAEGGNAINVARNSAYFTTPTASVNGLITTYTNPSGRFALDTYASFEADDVMPTNLVDAWYWLDPVISGLLVTCPTVNIISTLTKIEQADYKDLVRSVTGVVTVTVEDNLNDSTFNYNETGRTVIVLATTDSADQADFEDHQTVTGVVTVADVDTAHRRDLDWLASIASTVSGTDLAHRRELDLPLAIASTLSVGVDQADFEDPLRAVSVISTVVGSDVLSGAPIIYNETGRNITVVSTYTQTDQADYEDHQTVAVVSTLTHASMHRRFETLALSVVSTTSSADQADFKDLVRSVGIVSTFTLLETTGVLDERNRAVSITALVTSTDRARFTNQLSLDAAVTVGLSNVAAYHLALSMFVLSTVSLYDLPRYANGVVINTALALYLGDVPVQRVYVGSTQVWP